MIDDGAQLGDGGVVVGLNKMLRINDAISWRCWCGAADNMLRIAWMECPGIHAVSLLDRGSAINP